MFYVLQICANWLRQNKPNQTGWQTKCQWFNWTPQSHYTRTRYRTIYWSVPPLNYSLFIHFNDRKRLFIFHSLCHICIAPLKSLSLIFQTLFIQTPQIHICLFVDILESTNYNLVINDYWFGINKLAFWHLQKR